VEVFAFVLFFFPSEFLSFLFSSSVLGLPLLSVPCCEPIVFSPLVYFFPCSACDPETDGGRCLDFLLPDPTLTVLSLINHV
jgi:hypothetical protein